MMNTSLIAAAPDLLRELQTAVAWIEDDSEYRPTADEILPQLHAAIAKATIEVWTQEQMDRVVAILRDRFTFD